jgi:hypothetical protein
LLRAGKLSGQYLFLFASVKTNILFFYRIGYAETKIVVAVARIVVVPISRTAVVRIVVPAASAFHPVGSALR